MCEFVISFVIRYQSFVMGHSTRFADIRHSLSAAKIFSGVIGNS